MNKKGLWVLWGGLYILCAGLGFIPEPAGFLKGMMTALAVFFFIPGFLLLYQAKQQRDKQTAALVRNLAAASLGATVLLIVANFLSIGAAKAVGDGLYAMLVIVSSPMVSGGNWLLSLFLWACLLVAGGDILRKRK